MAATWSVLLAHREPALKGHRMSRMESPTVFIVEDESETRDSFAALISSMDLAVETFASGEEFLQGVDADGQAAPLLISA